MSNPDNEFKRWYDKDNIVSKCISLLENTNETLKHQTATFLMNEIITHPPYINMVADEAYSLVISEIRKRRWYDFDEVYRIFIELLKHSPKEVRKQIALKAIEFIDNSTEL